MPSVLQTVIVITSLILSAILGGALFNAFINRYPKRLFRQWWLECREFIQQYDEGVSEDDPISFQSLTCPHCKNALKPWQYIATLSYIFYANRCQQCQTKLTSRGLVVEWLCLLLLMVLYLEWGPSWLLLVLGVLCWSLAVISFIDLDHHLVLDNLVYPLLWCGLLINITGYLVPLPLAVLGAVIGYLAIFLPAKLYQKLRGQAGVGMGDAKLIAALGAWLGLFALPYIIIGGFILATAIFLFTRILYKINPPLALAPCLAISTYVYILL